jgi:hypothetical protein
MMAGNLTNRDLQTRDGRCPEHGTVQATRPMPRMRFPFIILGALRLWAGTRPFHCPTCGATVERA